MRAMLVMLAPLLAGCPDRTIADVPVEQGTVEVKDIPVEINRDLDILFLIDRSPTMADEQDALAAAFPQFMNILAQIDGGLPNVHVGVISQDIGVGGVQGLGGSNCSGDGDGGRLQVEPMIAGCTPPAGNYISDLEIEGSVDRTRNYAGTLGETFGCIAKLGPQGCGFEQHLGSLEKALIGNPTNAGFLRPNALLAIIIISDEDDCTASNPAIYDPANGAAGPLADFRCFEWGWECDEGTMDRQPGTYTNCRPREDSPYLRHPDDLVEKIKALKAAPKNVVVATIIGPSATTTPAVTTTSVTIGTPPGGSTTVPMVSPSCGTMGGQNAFPMPRLAHFAQQFENNAFFSLCNDRLQDGLTQIARLIRREIGDSCFESDDLRDLDPQNPGTQLACSVSDVSPVGETIIPACRMADADTVATDSESPCWYVRSNPMRCATYPTQLEIVVHPPDRPFATGTHTTVHCVSD